MNNCIKKFLGHILTFFALLISDLATKQWALTLVGCPSWLQFSFIKYCLDINKGVAFGILKQLGNYDCRLLSFLIVVFISLFFIHFIKEYQERSFATAEIMVLAGGVGNLISRIIHGGVIDFIKITIIPSLGSMIINLADVYIFFGILLILRRQINYVLHKP